MTNCLMFRVFSIVSDLFIRRVRSRHDLCQLQQRKVRSDNAKKTEEEPVGNGGRDLRWRGAAVNKSRDKFRKSPN